MNFHHYQYNVIKQDFLDSLIPMVSMDNDLDEEVDNNSAEEEMKLHHLVATLVQVLQLIAMLPEVIKQLTTMLEPSIIMPPLLMLLKQHTMEIPLPMLLLLN